LTLIHQINLLAYMLGSIRFSTAFNIPHFSIRLLCTWT